MRPSRVPCTCSATNPPAWRAACCTGNGARLLRGAQQAPSRPGAVHPGQTALTGHRRRGRHCSRRSGRSRGLAATGAAFRGLAPACARRNVCWMPVRTTAFGFRRRHEFKVQALAKLRHPAVLQAIEQARRWDTPTTPPLDRAQLARTLAAGYASQGRFADAYREIERRDRLTEDARSFAADVQTLRLQARYAAAQRESENAELRHREEASRLALEAQTATAACLVGHGGHAGAADDSQGAYGPARPWFAAAPWPISRCVTNLTGQPNRRAVRAYADAQVQQAQRLGVPLALAIIDLDHFKAVNDSLGHAGGDSVLRAFASAATSVLARAGPARALGRRRVVAGLAGHRRRRTASRVRTTAHALCRRASRWPGRTARLHVFDGCGAIECCCRRSGRADCRGRPPALPSPRQKAATGCAQADWKLGLAAAQGLFGAFSSMPSARSRAATASMRCPSLGAWACMLLIMGCIRRGMSSIITSTDLRPSALV
jgi:GGDEF domain-containing protein